MRTILHFVLTSSVMLVATSALAEDPPESGKRDVEVLQIQEVLRRPMIESQLFSVQLGSDDGLRNTAKAIDFTFALSTLNGLGIDVTPAEGPLRAQLKLPENVGLVVTTVPEESVGAKAGIKRHDVLIGIGDKSVGEAAKLAELLAAADGKAVKLHLVRGGQNIVIEATPKKPEVAQLELGIELDQFVLDKLKGTSIDAERYRLGVTLDEADATLRAQLGLATGEGLVVTDVVEDSAAAEAGVKAHDVLTLLDGTRLTTVDAVNAQIQEIKDREVELRLLRGGKEQSFQIAPRKSSESVRATDAHRFLNVNNCQSCHANAWQDALLTWDHDAVLKAHQFHGGGQHFHLWPQRIVTVQPATATTEPAKQLATLKEQLAAMQETLVKLEAALQPHEPAEEEKEKKEE